MKGKAETRMVYRVSNVLRAARNRKFWQAMMAIVSKEHVKQMIMMLPTNFISAFEIKCFLFHNTT